MMSSISKSLIYYSFILLFFLSFFVGLVGWLLDDRQTCLRLELLAGPDDVSRAHRYAAFVYWIIFLDLTWMPFGV